ncbi:DUF3068 domain-containing protein [Solicola sp. PLA-1-18]|uniref:DUF3068 domain-containing protein n=1 Tax=Solicola sp. PLA-1-18 TaxID=3380532 RepID=UPI003B7B93DD
MSERSDALEGALVGKKTGFVLLFVGVFLLALAALARFYAYDQLAVVPLDQQSTTQSTTGDGDATYLNVAAEGGPAIETGPLESRRQVVGQVEDSKKATDDLGEDVAVWDTLSYVAPPGFDPASGDPLSGTRDLVAFDRHTGAAVKWDGETTESAGVKDDVTFTGQYFKFPFNAQKKTYQFWDGSLRKATDATFVDTDEIDGLAVYKYEQKIPATKIAELAVPGSLVGEASTPSVTADRMYANTRTLWVEPETGVIIKGQEDQLSTLAVDGETKATITKATLGYDDKTVSDTVDEYASRASSLKAIRLYVPIGGLVLGVVLVAGGVVLLRRGRGAEVRGDHTAV